MTRRGVGRSRERNERGAASLEYVGSLFVVGLIVTSLVAAATPIGGAIKEKICEAWKITCAASPAAQRAKDLGIKCTVSKADDKLNINGSVDVRVERTDKGAVTAYGDNSGQVVLSQGAGVGADFGSTVLNSLGVKAKITANGDAGLVYKFPPEYGGSKRANAFLDEKRDVVHTVAEIMLPIGTQKMEEDTHEMLNAGHNFFEDHVMTPLGFGPTDAERQATLREQRAQTADAVQLSLSIQGNVGITAGAGVKRTTNGGGSTSKEELRAPVSATASANAALNGTVTIPLHDDGPDAVAASFTGEVSIDGAGEIALGGSARIPPFLNMSIAGGLKGSYTVGFDKAGNPTSLTMTTEVQGGYGNSLQPKIYGNGSKLKEANKDDSVHVTTQVLDLNSKTEAGAANRAAFDQAFDVIGGTVAGHAVKIAQPKGLINPIGLPNPVQLWDDWSALQPRFSADAFTTNSSYVDTTTEYGGDVKAEGWGLGGTYSDKSRQLESATLHDNRYGVDVQLATCPH